VLQIADNSGKNLLPLAYIKKKAVTLHSLSEENYCTSDFGLSTFDL
jgi:hypothetical protein